jgi:hypothetical protein
VAAFRTFVWFGTAILRQQELASMIANNSIRHCRAKTRQSMGKPGVLRADMDYRVCAR